MPKELAETRGYVISDYQSYLEKEWIASLKQKYTVKVNKEVFNSLIR
jgi:peptidyl-prolyl cis-trans isomerase SurA